MEQYWATRPKRLPAQTAHSNGGSTPERSHLSEFDRHRQMLVEQNEGEEEGWAAELRRYLKDMPADVSKETDIVEWWQVCQIVSILMNRKLINKI